MSMSERLDTAPQRRLETLAAQAKEAQRTTDSSTSRMHDGTGLGRAIARNFVELRPGTIWVESELGKGSRVFSRCR